MMADPDPDPDPVTAGFSDRGPAVFAVTTATLVLATLFVAARMLCRAGIVRNVSWDDYIMAVAWLFAFFLSFTVNLGTRHGLGRHDTDIDPGDSPTLRICEYVFSVLYNPALMATKTSILVFYLRLANNTQKMLRVASWAVLVIVNIAGIILTFMNIFQCQPVRASWDIDAQAVQCIPLLTEFICSAPVNITTDLAILALPIPVLTGMRLPSRQKTILVITFTFGIFVTVVDVVRIYYLQQAVITLSSSASGDSTAMFGESPDFSWNASLALMWSAVEVNTAMACACVPTLKPLVTKILPVMLVNPRGTRQTSPVRERRAGYGTVTHGSKQEGSDRSQLATTATTDSVPRSPREPPPTRAHSQPSMEMTMMEFLVVSTDMQGPPARGSHEPLPPPLHRRSQTTSRMTAPAGAASREDSVYFGFVNMKKPKSMLKTSGSEAFMYCAVVTSLFFLWGFSYGLLNTLNNVIADIAQMTMAETLGLTSAYFGGGYFFGPLLVGGWILRHDEHHHRRQQQQQRRRRRRRQQQQQQQQQQRKGRNGMKPVGGFKMTMITGLLIYGTGTIMFWPSAVLSAFGGFMVSSFVVGFGLGVLETAANPFLVLCGPPQYSEVRILVAQGVQGVGSVLSGLLAGNVFFASISSKTTTPSDYYYSTALLDVQWTYLAVTLLCVLLALFLYYTPLPEVGDGELARLSNRLPVDPKKRSVGRVSLRTWCIALAVTAQWLYVAAQECMSFFFQRLLTAYTVLVPTTIGSPKPQAQAQPPGLALSVMNYLLVAHTAFAVSRFLVASVAYLSVRHPHWALVPTPRTLLTISTALTALFALLAVVLRPTGNANLMAVPITLFFFGEAPIWPLVFALGLRGQGDRTKLAAVWLTAGASGPAFWPFVQYAVLQRGSGGANSGAAAVQDSYIVVVALVVVILAYPLFLTFVRDARTMVDPPPPPPPLLPAPRSDTSGRHPNGSGTTTPDMDDIIAMRLRRRAAASEQKQRHGSLSSPDGFWGKAARGVWPSMSSGVPVVEHREGNGGERGAQGQGQGRKGEQEGERSRGQETDLERQQDRRFTPRERSPGDEDVAPDDGIITPDEGVPPNERREDRRRGDRPAPWESMVLDTTILTS